MDKTDWLLLTLCVILLGSYYGSYLLGKHLERREYTKAFIASTETTYWEGFNDGQEIGRKQGYEVGKTDGYNKCLNED